MKKRVILGFFLTLLLFSFPSFQFESDELLLDDEEFGLDGAPPCFPGPASIPAATRSSRKRHSESESDSKIQFSLEQAFGDSEFVPAGTFSARLKTWNHGGQTLTKLRFSRNGFTDDEKKKFKRCLPLEGLDEHFVIHTEGVNILAVNYGSTVACPYPRHLELPSTPTQF